MMNIDDQCVCLKYVLILGLEWLCLKEKHFLRKVSRNSAESCTTVIYSK